MIVAIDEESELGDACPSALDACGPSLTASCRVSCQPTADGCANVWELYRLKLGPSELQGEWLAFDAEGQHGIFERFTPPGPDCRNPATCGITEPEPPPKRSEYFSWSAADGVVPLAAAVDAESELFIHQVSDDASVARGQRGSDHFYWTRAAALQPLPMRNPAMARNGRLFAGVSEGEGVRWAPGAGEPESFEIEDLARGLAEGDAALFFGVRSLVYSPAAGERIDIALPSDVSAEANIVRVVLAASGTSFALLLQDGEQYRLYRWADGVFQRIEPPALTRATLDFSFGAAPVISDDGGVVVARIESTDGSVMEPQEQVVRWSAETGTQLLSDDPTFEAKYVSVTGDVIFGTVELEFRPALLRWSLDAGMQDTGAPDISERITLDGDVLVDWDDDGVLLQRYAGASGVPLSLDHLRGRLLMQRPFWLLPRRVSPDARMLGGMATDDPGNSWLWVARLQTTCPDAP